MARKASRTTKARKSAAGKGKTSGEEKRRKYSDFDARGCTRCAFNGKNRLLNDLVEPPTHPEFP